MHLNTTIYKKYSDSINLPHLIEVDQNIVVAAFALMKLIPAKYVIEKAIRQNVLRNDMTVVETSSGTYALGLAIVCAENGIPFTIFSDPVIDQHLKQQLELLGGRVVIVEDHRQGHQVARLKALKEYLQDNPSAFWPQQYDNSDHLQAYAPFADYLRQSLGEDLILVASVGSGSSSCGTIQRLRAYNPAISLIGVDTFGSVLFGLKNGERLLRGLGNSILPNNLLHDAYDQVHWLSASQAFFSTKDLYSSLGLYAGPTSGACYQVAQWVARQYPNKRVVFIAPDMGYRYASTVYNDDWLKSLGSSKKVSQPVQVADLVSVHYSMDWACFDWNRVALSKVLNGYK